MGRDLLAEDYMLKQITASLIYPEDIIGKKFWKRIYEEAQKKFGTTNVPVNTFNKVWIIPEKAVVYENAKSGTAYIIESKLKVMLEQDYLSMQKHAYIGVAEGGASTLGCQIIREIVIPELNKEINQDKNFTQLRQVYNSLILATWYKMKIKDSILLQVYADKNKTLGLSFTNVLIGDPEHIYQQYLKAFKKGAYNYIKEEINPMTQEIIPRKYFSGGMDDTAMATTLTLTHATPKVLASDTTMKVVADISPDMAMETVVSQHDLPDLYWGTVAGIVMGFVRDFIDGKKMVAKELSNAANELFRKYTPSDNGQEEAQLRERMTGVNSQGRMQLNLAVVLSAFISQQAIGNNPEKRGYTNVYLPRDMGLGYTIEKTLSAISGEERDPQIYYLSRDNLEGDVYTKVSDFISALSYNIPFHEKIQGLDYKDQMKYFLQEIRRQILNDKDCVQAVKKIIPELRSLGLIKKGVKVRFVDTGFKTFPIMLQAILTSDDDLENIEGDQELMDFYQELNSLDIQTDGLVINSSVTQFLAELNPKRWDEGGRGLAEMSRFKGMVNPGILDVMEDFIPHPIMWDSTQGSLVKTQPAAQREAYATQVMFGFGAVEYQQIINELEVQLQQQGLTLAQSQKAAPLLIDEILGISIPKADEKVFHFIKEIDVKSDNLGKSFSEVMKTRKKSIEEIMTAYVANFDISKIQSIFFKNRGSCRSKIQSGRPYAGKRPQHNYKTCKFGERF